jgi:O-antigen ligase
MNSNSTSSLPDPQLMLAVALAAASGPSLLAYNVSPSPTFLNQALALALWGWFAAVAALCVDSRQSLLQAARASALPLGALVLLLLSVLWSWGPGALPSGLALSAIGLLMASMLLLLGGAAVRGSAQALPLFALFCLGWVVAGALNAGIGIVQVFAPAWPDGDWIARSGIPGRAVGNLRQPNHLSSLLLWSAMAIVPLLELGRLRRALGAALFALMVFAVVLTASRTGLLGVGMLALWGLIDRRLSRSTRWMLLASLPLYALAWLGLAAWAEVAQHTFGGEARLAEADLSGSRFGIWSNTLALIRLQPWAGVGFGEFNLAWTLTPFPGRPVAFFDHTHNLPLQLAVELGVPLASVVLALLVVALWRIWRLSLAADGPASVTLRSACVMLLLIGLHSQLEYPLWYAYFLLPTAWLFGYGLGLPAAPLPGQGTRPRALFVGGMLLVAGSALSLVDYLRVVSIFAPASDASPLSERIAAGRHSWLFAHHADYASVTTDDEATPGSEAFTQAPHYLMDTRLMIAWANALAAAGELDKARFVAQRLREFRNPQAREFFEPCELPQGDTQRPFQCELPQAAPDWRAFVR